MLVVRIRAKQSWSSSETVRSRSAHTSDALWLARNRLDCLRWPLVLSGKPLHFPQLASSTKPSAVLRTCFS